MRKRTKRWLLVSLTALVCFLAASMAPPVFHLARTPWRDRRDLTVLARQVVDDASRMNPTLVVEIWDVPPDPLATEEQLRALFRRAKERKLRVSFAGARHSMGGHVIAPGGIVLNMLPVQPNDGVADPRTHRRRARRRWRRGQRLRGIR